MTLSGYGGYPCFWSPWETVTNPLSCRTTAHPSGSTTYSVTMTSYRDPNCSFTASVAITVVRPAAPPITAPRSAAPGEKGLTATVPEREGRSYGWTIFNGVLTSGQGSNVITFTAGPAPVLVDGMEVGVILSVVETTGICESEKGSAAVAISSGTVQRRRQPFVVPFR